MAMYDAKAWLFLGIVLDAMLQRGRPLHLRLLDQPDVRHGRVSTKWLERWLAEEAGGRSGPAS